MRKKMKAVKIWSHSKDLFSIILIMTQTFLFINNNPPKGVKIDKWNENE